MNQEKKFTILCVDDDDEFRTLISSSLKRLGYQVISASGVNSGIEAIEKNHTKISLVISDFKMADGNGFDLRERMLESFKEIPFVIVSGFVDKDMAMKGLKFKISNFIEKPYEEDTLRKVIEEESADRIQYLEELIELKASFLSEANDIIEEIEPVLVSIKRDNAPPQSFDLVFRLIHTLKGSSGVLERPELTSYLHLYEDLIGLLRDGLASDNDSAVEVLLVAFDKLVEVIELIQEEDAEELNLNGITNTLKEEKAKQITGTRGKSTTKSASKNQENSKNKDNRSDIKDTVMVPTEMLDEFMIHSGEITVIRNMIKKLVFSIERKLPSDKDVGLLADLLENMNKINSNMHSQISEQRKQDVHSFVKRFPRAVRELSRQLDKPAILNIIGEDIRVDPKIAAVLGKCLIHLIRNSMDHGIESKEKRQANGKMLEGKIDLSFLEEGENTIITISDDGGGIDVEKIKAKIIDKDLYTEDQLNKMSKSKILSQIFEPGFSTAEKVTDVSGRGVGMDMVKSSIESVNGRIELDSELGNGTVIKLVVPVPKSVTIIQALLVTAGTHTYSIPQESVFRLLSFSKEEECRYFRDYEGGRVLFVNNRLLPIIDLEKFLDIKVNVGDGPRGDSDDNINFVILNSKDEYFALKVDKILDAEDVVVKQLIRGIMNIGPYKGATFLADGSVGLILDCDKIIEMSRFISPEEIRQETDGGLVDSLVNEDELLIFKIKGMSQSWAIRLSEIFRLEEINISEYQSVGGNKVINYRDIISPVIDLQSTLQDISDEEISEYEILEKNLTLVIERQKRFYFLIIDSVQDVKMQTSEIKVELRDSDFIEGTTIVGDDIIAVIDVTNVLSVSPFFDPQEERKEELDNIIEINKAVDEPEEKLKGVEVGEYEVSDVDLANGFGFF